jgi:hypothetical protein
VMRVNTAYVAETLGVYNKDEGGRDT